MRYGFCTGFAAGMAGPIDYRLLEDIEAAGYDFVEFPLMQTAALSGGEFDALADWLAGRGLGADCTCNMFPARLRLTGPERGGTAVREYLELAFARLARLGTKKIVLGSSGARNLPAGVGEDEGYAQLESLLRERVLPLLEEYGCTVAVEPINRDEANFICTLPEGMELVRRAGHPRVRLLADTIHMLREGEDPEEFGRFRPWLEHIHVSEIGRGLPARGYTPKLAALLDALREAGSTDTVSFETGPCTREEMAGALRLLKKTLEG